MSRPALIFAALLTAAAALGADDVKKDEPGVWKERDSKGALKRISRDTNSDGKPDSHQLYVSGRTVVLREVDSNHDGKIDRRRLVEWATIKYGPGLPETPGYRNLWREEDSNFDGLVDIFTERGKTGPSERIGKPMDTRVTPLPEEERTEEEKAKGDAQRLVDDRNERYGL
jgi:hypothetical protein